MIEAPFQEPVNDIICLTVEGQRQTLTFGKLFEALGIATAYPVQF